MIIISIYTLELMIFVSILTVMDTAEPLSPCPSELNSIVADMCTANFVVEEYPSGSDSVLLSITKQQNNCICHVNLQEVLTNYTIYMSKYQGLSSSSPSVQSCGLAVDVDYVDTSNTTRYLESIDCSSGTSTRAIALGGSTLKLKSRIINGTFTKGYCMQISRNQSIYNCTMTRQDRRAGHDDDRYEAIPMNSLEKCEEYCLNTEACVSVAFEQRGQDYCFVNNKTTSLLVKDNSTYSRKECVDNQKLQIRCYHHESPTQTSHVTTTEDNHSTQKETVPTSGHPVTNSNTKSTKKIENEVTSNIYSIPERLNLVNITADFIDCEVKDEKTDLYVYIGAAGGGVLMLLLIVFIVVCIRNRSNHTSLKEPTNDSTNEFCSDRIESDNDYGGLKDNILYVSSEPNEILEDGNYNTVDLEQTRKVNQDISFDGEYSTVDRICSNSSLSKSKPVVKPKPKTNANSSIKRASVDETIHLSTMDNSNNEYAVVDKGRNSDAVKHINPEHGNDTEYAVVNKVKKSGNNN